MIWKVLLRTRVYEMKTVHFCAPCMYCSSVLISVHCVAFTPAAGVDTDVDSGTVAEILRW